MGFQHTYQKRPYIFCGYNQPEASRLYNRKQNIEHHEASFKADGVVTQQVRRQLRKELSALSEQVERMLRSNRHS